MKVIRKGNDINILWEIFGEIDGVKSPYDLTGKDLSLYLGSKYGRKEVTDFSTEENMVIWSFRGKDQKNLGVYSLILVVNEGEEFMHTIDECDAFEIVSHTCIAEQECKENLRISTQFNIGAITPDTSLDPDSLNVVTNAAICEALEAFRNEVNTQLAQFEEATGADLSAYKAEVNAAFADYKVEVNGTLFAAVEELRGFETRIQADLDAFIAEVNATLASANAEAEAFRAAIEQSYTQFTTSIEQSFAEFKNTINSELASEFGAQNTRISEAINQQNATIASEVQKQNAAIESKTAQQNATISSAIEQQNTTIATEFEKQNARIADKVSSDGKYPKLTAGFANNLVGRGEAVDATIGFRASGGMSIEDGAARVKELHGNSVVWNQTYRPTQRPAKNGVRTTINGNEITLQGTTEAVGDGPMLNFTEFSSIPIGHKCAVLSSIPLKNGDYLIDTYNVSSTIDLTKVIFEKKADFIIVQIKLTNVGVSYDGVKGKIAVIDLTQMFGAGNEPTTLEEFYARIPQNVDLYAYNEGEIVSTDADGIKSVGFNAWDEEWEQGYYDTGRIGTTLQPVAATNRFRSKNPIKVLPNTQYCLMTDMDYMVIIFCDNDGIVLTEIAYGNGATFTTPTNCGYLHFFQYVQVANASYTGKICINLSHTGYRNGEYQPYMQFIRDIDTRIREAFPNGLRSAGNAHDKVYNKNGKGYIEKRIEARAYQQGDATSATMITDGNTTFYELAEPIITEYDEPFNLDYEVWDFGTEQMLSSRPSAPIKAKIAYGFNAVDMVRTAQIEIAELKTQIAQMQTMMASLAAQPAMIDYF